jgi:hypothetical protein
MTLREGGALLGGALALLMGPARLAAQGYTAEVGVQGRMIELRGLVQDSLPEGQVPGDGLQRTLEDGTVVFCIPNGFCRWYPSGEEETVSLVTQDVRVSTWTGIRGLAAHVHVRGRYGSDDFWPRSEQELEAVYAYVSYEREPFRVRAGRQHRVNGLGYYNFDGGAFLWRGFDPVRVEVYGGWSLARNLNAPRTGSLLQDADEFAPDDRGYLVGADVRADWGRWLSGALTYQREIRTDELALYTERVAGDVGVRLAGVSVDLAADYDLGWDELNEASVRVSTPLPRGFSVMGEARRYTPHFELWTIWGAFSPVGFDEGRLWAAWSAPAADLRLEAGAAFREYEETDAGAVFVGLEDSGWRAFGRASYGRGGWFARGSYRAEEGSGAARYGGDLSLGYEFDPGTWIALRGTSSQSFSEFRLGEQVTAGGGIDGALRLGEARLVGGWAVYDVTYEGRPAVEDWRQVRGHLGVSYRFGSETARGAVVR